MQVEFYFSTEEYKKARDALLTGRSPCDVVECSGQFCVNCPLSQYFKKQYPEDGALAAGIEYMRTHMRDRDQFKHAHWIKRYEEHKTESGSTFSPLWDCSSCKTSYRPDLAGGIKYCPECGAKMDERGEK